MLADEAILPKEEPMVCMPEAPGNTHLRRAYNEFGPYMKFDHIRSGSGIAERVTCFVKCGWKWFLERAKQFFK